MKKAFTLLELVLVVVIIGIVAAVTVPRLNNTHIDKAAQQVLQHIRYTQHLAMMDNKFDPNDPNWFKKRWQIKFNKDTGNWSYTIFTDLDLNNDPSTVLSKKEIAKNPMNPEKQILTGLSSSSKRTKEMQLGISYGISSVSFSSSCSIYQSKILYFDYLGRPMKGVPSSLETPYFEDNHDKNYLLQDRCNITLTDNEENFIVISIEPETGYAYISQINRS